MFKIEIFSENILLPYNGITKKYCKAVAAAAAEFLSLEHVSLSIIIVDDEYIRKINREYRNLDRPTDVISFSNREIPFPTIDDSSEEIGDIYISIERAHFQSSESDVSLQDELKRLIVHGMLHLIGYDHERSEADEEIMLSKQEEICNNISL